jgi:hypothetical protein
MIFHETRMDAVVKQQSTDGGSTQCKTRLTYQPPAIKLMTAGKTMPLKITLVSCLTRLNRHPSVPLKRFKKNGEASKSPSTTDSEASTCFSTAD